MPGSLFNKTIITVIIPKIKGIIKRKDQWTVPEATTPNNEEMKLEEKNRPTARPRTDFAKSFPIVKSPSGTTLAAAQPLIRFAISRTESDFVIPQYKLVRLKT